MKNSCNVIIKKSKNDSDNAILYCAYGGDPMSAGINLKSTLKDLKLSGEWRKLKSSPSSLASRITHIGGDFTLDYIISKDIDYLYVVYINTGTIMIYDVIDNENMKCKEIGYSYFK